MIDTSVKIDKKIEKSKRFVIVSDTHITPSGTEFNEKVFNKGIQRINAIKDVTLYLHLGDVTQSGTLLDYDFAYEQSQKFKPASVAPIEYLIGNHDALNVGYLLFEEIFGKRHFEYEDSQIYVIGIDSTKPDLGGGIIHHATIEAVKKRLAQPERQDKLKIVCFHHQLIPIPKTGKERSAIDDSGNMLKMLLDQKADLILNGHRHISNLYTLSSCDKDMYVFNAGTFCCNKTRYRELFTYSVIDILDNKLNFKIIPVLEPEFKKEIHRKIYYYKPREVDKNEKPYCKFVQMSHSLISENEEDKKTNLDIAIEKINEIEGLDLVVHCGNLTNNSYDTEFKIARDKLNALNHPYLVVPGFTDSKPPAWSLWDKYFGPLNPLFENEKIYFQGFDSTTPDSNIGFIGRKKLSRFLNCVLNLSHQKIFGACCFHNLIPTPLSVWRTELMDSGDALSQFSRSQISLVFNSTPSISFNVKIENTIFSNGGSLDGGRFEPSFLEISIYNDGLTVISENSLRSDKKKTIGKYTIEILK
ncbi:MAG: metallophosphoesterase [Candidatus Lokiarchaeota archaeon]|nr:metallophosphoesterase [Candidatus Lokiarchaeota archaeon]